MIALFLFTEALFTLEDWGISSIIFFFFRFVSGQQRTNERRGKKGEPIIFSTDQTSLFSEEKNDDD